MGSFEIRFLGAYEGAKKAYPAQELFFCMTFSFPAWQKPGRRDGI